MFLTQVPSYIPDEEPQSLQIFVPSTHIMFSPEDMQLGKHDNFTSYLGLIEVNHILVDPGFALNIVPRRVMQHLEILASRLSSIDTMIYGFKASGACALGKIMFKCQIRDLRSEITYYIKDSDASYNLLLGRLWFHQSRGSHHPPSGHEVH